MQTQATEDRHQVDGDGADGNGTITMPKEANKIRECGRARIVELVKVEPLSNSTAHAMADCFHYATNKQLEYLREQLEWATYLKHVDEVKKRGDKGNAEALWDEITQAVALLDKCKLATRANSGDNTVERLHRMMLSFCVDCFILEYNEGERHLPTLAAAVRRLNGLAPGKSGEDASGEGGAS